ncbi:MAG: methyltransferase domain-containing protein [Legionellaceae bacterium]|nr:methyltransferase domain-containing protein [Legionellaceae bacterium]
MVLYEQQKYELLDEWYNTAQGSRVATAFGAELNSIRNHISGNKILQLGPSGENDWLSILRFRNRMLVSPSLHIQKATFYASINNLPIQRESIDCVLAPLTVEVFSKKIDPIEEIDRILKPHGYAIFFGINPCSFWGAATYIKKISCFAHSSVKLRSSLEIKHALLNRGYRQCVLHSFYYIPPFKRSSLILRLEFLNEMGKMMWPYPAGFYCLIVQKFDPCMPFPEEEQAGLSLPSATF